MADVEQAPAPISRRAYSINEVAEMFGVGRNSVYNLMHDGRLRAAKINGRTVVTATEIDRFSASLDGEGAG